MSNPSPIGQLPDDKGDDPTPAERLERTKRDAQSYLDDVTRTLAEKRAARDALNVEIATLAASEIEAKRIVNALNPKPPRKRAPKAGS